LKIKLIKLAAKIVYNLPSMGDTLYESADPFNLAISAYDSAEQALGNYDYRGAERNFNRGAALVSKAKETSFTKPIFEYMIAKANDAMHAKAEAVAEAERLRAEGPSNVTPIVREA
jgi:hypothetical protein